MKRHSSRNFRPWIVWLNMWITIALGAVTPVNTCFVESRSSCRRCLMIASFSHCVRPWAGVLWILHSTRSPCNIDSSGSSSSSDGDEEEEDVIVDARTGCSADGVMVVDVGTGCSAGGVMVVDVGTGCSAGGVMVVDMMVVDMMYRLRKVRA